MAIGLAATACSSAPTRGSLGLPGRGSPTPVPAAGASPPPPLLAVVEARGSGSHYGALPGLGDSYDTVAIAGYDGYARARQTFKPRAVPKLPAGGTPLLPPPAVAVGSSVFFADGDGIVRRLERTGTTTQVADFATGPQQELWFAVSPDGEHVAAAVVSVPAAGADWMLDLKMAVAGGQVTTLKHQDLGAALPSPELVVGWDAGGPLVTLGSALVGSAAVSGWQYHGSALAHMEPSGDPGPPLGGAGCTPWASAPDGTLLCAGSPPSVRDPAGNVVWSVPPGAYSLQGRALSPDAEHVATDSVVIAAGGWAEKLPAGFVAEGWADADHLLGQAPEPAGKGHLEYVTVGDALRPHDLGFIGVIVGPVD